ncbi:MAG: hypothetical protein U0Q11_06095 [Vicinamibacterales bacterium]
MNQIAMRRVHFDDIEVALACAEGRLAECVHDTADLVDRQRMRHRIVVGKRRRGRADRFPSAVFRRHRTRAVPRALGAAFSPGMRELDAKG